MEGPLSLVRVVTQRERGTTPVPGAVVFLLLLPRCCRLAASAAAMVNFTELELDDVYFLLSAELLTREPSMSA